MLHTKMKFPNVISCAILLSLPAGAMAATPSTWTTNYDIPLYGSSGAITFNDWGYQGPNGANAGSFAVTSTVTGITGFDASRVGQVQNVLTQDPDWKSPDPAITTNMKEFAPVARANSSQDAQVNFYQWTYTTVGGSTFNNMTIDKAGNYFVAKNDMAFKFYDVYKFHDETGVKVDKTIDTDINFQPYAVSDARGWCGSTLVSNPNGLDVMAGQVTFDFAFDTYTSNQSASLAGGDTQIVPDFVMRSYGSYDVNLTTATGDNMHFTGSAVMNNNNPEANPLDVNGVATGAALDPTYRNLVSFLGGGVVPKGAWVTADSYTAPGVKRLNADGTWNVNVAVDGPASVCDPYNTGAAPVAGAVCYGNSFGGFAFLMRADGKRILTFIDPTGHSDYVTTDAAAYASLTPVPVPAAAWLLGSGVLGLGAIGRRHKKSAQ